MVLEKSCIPKWSSHGVNVLKRPARIFPRLREIRGSGTPLCGALGNLGNCRSTATRRGLNSRPRHARAQHSSYAGVPVYILGPAAVDAFRLSPRNALCLATPTVLVILPGDRGEHVEQHGIDGGKHTGRELIAGRSHLPGCRQVERHDANLLNVQFGSQLAPVRVSQSREAVNLLDQKHVARLGVR